ncbi:MAG: protein kinase [Gemmatimonadota bacterium]
MTIDRLTAALSDRYRLDRELGAGGMATVYLAHDVKHDRKVAIKVLRPELAAVIGAERFLAEIKTTANLQHPHILPLFDSGVADSFLFYVMPYVEGISLRDRMTREKQLPIGEAVRIASEIAAALDYAHRHGVIHRDIKPENILLHDGSALVADFGIALAASKAGTRMTETGMSLGTPQYMSPEQAMGERELDARSDVYALGCVTYEMLTGEPPFSGPTAQAIVAKVMTAEPATVTSLRKTIPEHVADAVHTALQKLPADRFASAAEFSMALNDKVDATRSATRTRAVRSAPAATSRSVLAAGFALVAISLAAGWLIRGGTSKATSAPPVEFAFRLGDGGRDRPYVAISPDGQRVVQAVQDSSGVDHLVMRTLGSTALRVIAGTESGENAEFSHDGNWIAFARNGKLFKVPTSGGPPTELVDSTNAGSAWSLDDASLIYAKSGIGLWRVAATGGTPTRLTTLDTARREFNHWYPQSLPGGKAAIFTSYATPLARARIEAVEFATGKRTVLVEGAVFGRYATSGHLLYARDGAVFAVHFDPASLKVIGAAVPVVEDVAWLPTDGQAGFAIAENGTLVYLKASEWAVKRRVVWADRAGNLEPALRDSGSWAQPRLSPDGKWFALTQTEPKRDLWLVERSRSVARQLTRAQGAAFNAVWTPDSRAIVYTFEDPVYDLHRLAIDGSAPDAVVFATPFDKRAASITPDGQTLAYTEIPSNDRLFLRPVAGGSSTPVDDQPGSQRAAAFSPDGRWIAYEVTNENEQPQIYVRAVDGHAGRIQISTDGGSQPLWTKGGREIVYRKGNALLAIPFQPATGEVGTAVSLFGIATAGRLDSRATGYDVTPDGARFLMVIPIVKADALPTHVILNWSDVLKQKVPK